ncbi:MAG: ADP-glyceromanno-heptose 6-epimerase [Chlamydiae bacterium]|jgi:ADP-L-glycero-D-manno-heptose 6-epimerase|nr:ADP-glyceromanno-heptose 6-epimerase [Chlamydiota bacterium]
MTKKIYDDQLIIITGALGFIGSGVVKYLNEKGYKNLVLVDDVKATEKWKNVVGKNFFEIVSRYELFHFLEGREKEIEAIIHLGACSDTAETDGDYLMENNYRYTISLAEYALNHQIRFVYASSAATYGNGELGYLDRHDLLKDLKPMNCYAFSKHAFDLWAHNQNVLNHLVGLKYFNVFGPNEAHKGKMASMVYHLYHQILSTHKAHLFASNDPINFKDGEQVRDFIYVKDVARLTCSFLENSLNGIYNLGSGQPRTWNEIAKTVFKAMGKPLKIEYISMPEHLAKSYQNYTAADMSKLSKDLIESKEPHFYVTPTEDAIKDYIQNYLMAGRLW